MYIDICMKVYIQIFHMHYGIGTIRPVCIDRALDSVCVARRIARVACLGQVAELWTQPGQPC